MTLPDAATMDRFRRDWLAVTGPDRANRALVAVSGGPDSTALLLLMAGMAGSVAPPFAATVDHRLRAESQAEAELAAATARSCGITHAILTGSLPERSGTTANLSTRARALRYALLQAHADAIGARWIVTAHHADDQLETMVMRLNRGSGVRGLAAIRSSSGRIARPLLRWRRSELVTLVAEAGMACVDDPSNVDDRFDRARLRKLLHKADWIDPLMVAQSASALAQADEAIEWIVDRVEQERCRFAGSAVTFVPQGIPAEITRRIAERCLRFVDPAITLRGQAVTRLIVSLGSMSPATLGSVSVQCVLAQLDGEKTPGWTFTSAPPRRSP